MIYIGSPCIVSFKVLCFHSFISSLKYITSAAIKGLCFMDDAFEVNFSTMDLGTGILIQKPYKDDSFPLFFIVIHWESDIFHHLLCCSKDTQNKCENRSGEM